MSTPTSNKVQLHTLVNARLLDALLEALELHIAPNVDSGTITEEEAALVTAMIKHDLTGMLDYVKHSLKV